MICLRSKKEMTKNCCRTSLMSAIFDGGKHVNQ